MIQDLLEILSEVLGLPHGWAESVHDGELDVIRLNHYPSMTVAADEYLCSAHRSIDLVTILLADSPGLQVADVNTTMHRKSRDVERDADFLDAHCEPGHFVVVPGSKLRRLSRCETPQPVHRVMPSTSADTHSRASIALHVFPSGRVQDGTQTVDASLVHFRTNGKVYRRDCDSERSMH